MEKPLDKIKRLSRSLPKNDWKYADKYIESREFSKLLEIVESDIYLVQKNEPGNHKYDDVDLGELMELAVSISEYIYFTVPDNNNYDY